MFISSPLLLACYLLAAGSSGGRGTGAERATNRSNQRGRGNDGRGRRGSGMNKGRKRYSRDGLKKQGSSSDNVSVIRQEQLSPQPPLTAPNGHRPLYFTCRHTYENTLIDEINRLQDNKVDLLVPCLHILALSELKTKMVSYLHFMIQCMHFRL